MRYEEDEHGRRRPVEIEQVFVSTQHRDGLDVDTLLKPDLAEHVLHPILPHDLYDEHRLEHDKDFFYCNPTGKFVIGGPMGDTGLPAKIIVDTYGGSARTAAAPSPARIRRRSTARRRTRPGTWRRTSSPPAWPSAARSRSRTLSASRTRFPSSSRRRHRGRARAAHRGARPRALRPAPGRDPPRPRPAPPDLREDRCVRPLGRSEREFTWGRTDKAAILRRAAGLNGDVPFAEAVVAAAGDA